MTNDEQQPQIQSQQDESEVIQSHPLTTSLGTVGGGAAGTALGHSIGGKVGAAIGAIAGAITGGIAANKLVEYAEEFIEELQPTIGLGLGADRKPIELPPHYSWEELQALSKPSE
ncbi:colicin V family bacteriocin [Nostoc sp. NMS4]|uniref:colicin V family bacteriocin n=1 Tax=Nostoc sp. NMS4 TaxID=2815390 RepID=UPI0025E51A97|nr:colicin V family bacteriocin [Nostoc sp. NMS4]MBN3927245.1 colicin V family bacteriocin [Nostoc sp. NMS4]